MILLTILVLLTINSGLAGGHSIEGFSGLYSLNDQRPASAPWLKEVVDSKSDIGRHVSMAIDPGSGQTFISYFGRELGGTLNLARYVGPGGNCGLHDSWKCQVLDSFGIVGEYNSVDTYPSQEGVRVIVSYYDFSRGSLKYNECMVKPSNFTCSTHTIDSGKPANDVYKGMHTSVKFDSKGEPHIAYQYYSDYADEAQLYARWVGDGTGNCGEGAVENNWQCDTIYSGGGVGMYASLDMDGENRPYIAFYDQGQGVPWLAQYIGPGGNCGSNNNWWCRKVNRSGMDTGRYVSLFVEKENNNPHLAYYNATSDMLEHAAFVDTDGNCGWCSISLGCEWQCDGIDDMGESSTSMGIAIAGDGRGRPLIAYQDASAGLTKQVLKIAHPAAVVDPVVTPNCGPANPSHTWYCETIDQGGEYTNEAGSVSVAVNKTRLTAIAYHEVDNSSVPVVGKLKLAYQRLQVFLPLTAKD
jgi:hypothetical protein